ncbi:hypothetical protein [Streptomyces aureocirculatus]|uniref:hypothetical protein n=1 Tax=Streptomyces aureocirculatus TaxID=67275 RepID=UPI0004C60046|nr:hypothetical protein [Streptomyces aureocirculatus]
MAADTAPRNRRKPAEPVLEHFYTLKKAAERLGLNDPDDPEDKTGVDWLRRGVNRKDGTPFPHHRMANQLMFSDSDLAVIAEMQRNKVDGRSKPRRSRRRPNSTTRSVTTTH